MNVDREHVPDTCPKPPTDNVRPRVATLIGMSGRRVGVGTVADPGGAYEAKLISISQTRTAEEDQRRVDRVRSNCMPHPMRNPFTNPAAHPSQVRVALSSHMKHHLNPHACRKTEVSDLQGVHLTQAGLLPGAPNRTATR